MTNNQCVEYSEEAALMFSIWGTCGRRHSFTYRWMVSIDATDTEIKHTHVKKRIRILGRNLLKFSDGFSSYSIKKLFVLPWHERTNQRSHESAFDPLIELITIELHGKDFSELILQRERFHSLD